jgi:hypothetical protein
MEQVEAAGLFMGPLLADANRQPWIPVGEQLPEEGVEVMLYGGGGISDAPCTRHGSSWNTRLVGVTHWMPLPEPPVAQEGDDVQEG